MVNWVEQLEEEVIALAEKSKVELTPGIVLLLEKFGELVESKSRSRHSFTSRLRRLNSEIVATGEIVCREVSEFRRLLKTYREQDFWNRALLCTYQHAETYLPVVRFRPIENVPELVIYVDRVYSNSLKGATYGLRAYDYCRGRLTGAVAQAANFLREHCNRRKWQVSVSELLNVWMDAIVKIPREQLLQSRYAHRSSKGKGCRAVTRRTAGWNAKAAADAKKGPSWTDAQLTKSIDQKKSETILDKPPADASKSPPNARGIPAGGRPSPGVINIDDDDKNSNDELDSRKGTDGFRAISQTQRSPAGHVRFAEGTHATGGTKSRQRSAPTPAPDCPLTVGIRKDDDKCSKDHKLVIDLVSFSANKVGDAGHPDIIDGKGLDSALEPAVKFEVVRGDNLKESSSSRTGTENKRPAPDLCTDTLGETVVSPVKELALPAQQSLVKKRRIVRRGHWKPRDGDGNIFPAVAAGTGSSDVCPGTGS